MIIQTSLGRSTNPETVTKPCQDQHQQQQQPGEDMEKDLEEAGQQLRDQQLKMGLIKVKVI